MERRGTEREDKIPGRDVGRSRFSQKVREETGQIYL